MAGAKIVTFGLLSARKRLAGRRWPGKDGMISYIVSAYSNKFVFGYLGIVSIGVLGFIV